MRDFSKETRRVHCADIATTSLIKAARVLENNANTNNDDRPRECCGKYGQDTMMETKKYSLQKLLDTWKLQEPCQKDSPYWIFTYRANNLYDNN